MEGHERQLLTYINWSTYTHHYITPIIWSVFIDIGVFIVLYKFRTIWMIMHMIIGFIVAVFSFLFALPLLIDFGIPAQETTDNQRRHRIMGLFILVIVGIQVLLGTISAIMKAIKWSSPTVIFYINASHKYLGYIILILAKIQLLITWDPFNYHVDKFWGILFYEIIFAFAIIYRKWSFPTMGKNIMMEYKDDLKMQKVLSIKSLKKQEDQPVAVFANYIFNLKPLLKYHPVGFRIIEGIKYRDLDRYLYGMYRTERDPKIPPNVHSFKALVLVGDPIAKLTIPQTYDNLENDYCDVRLKKIILISSKSGIYQIQLEGKDNTSFSYKGYQLSSQLGRFYSLTLNKKVTRLYTNVGFLEVNNVDFMDKNVFSKKGINIRPQEQKVFMNENETFQNINQQKTSLVLMMKKYEDGLLTKILLDSDPKDLNLQLSCARGEGLHFSELEPGKIIIVAGGTGLFPFCDLIDLLFKSRLLEQRPELRDPICLKDLVLNSEPFKGFNFSLYLAVANMQDIHPLTLAQMNELSKDPKLMKITLKVSKVSGQMVHKMNKNVEYTSERFSSTLEKILPGGEYERCWVCGPPVMNADMVSLFDRLNIPAEKYLIL